jgi:hypothetical protein
VLVTSLINWLHLKLNGTFEIGVTQVRGLLFCVWTTSPPKHNNPVIILIGIAILVFFQEQPYWDHAKELKNRTPLTPLELQNEFLPDIPLDVVEKFLQIVDDQFGEDPRLVRPQDNHCLINDDLDPCSFFSAIEETFGLSLIDKQLESLDGSFGSIARHIARHRKNEECL